jgi:arginyl-tRNA synthetase
MSFKGSALSTRKGNLVLADEVINTAREKVAKIIEEKNPELKNKQAVADGVAKAALKYYDLSHNRHSDIEFDWDEALDFNGNSGPYLQYVYARLSGILKKSSQSAAEAKSTEMTPTERQIAVELTKFGNIVEDSIKDFLPNILAGYLYHLAGLVNKFYHESPVHNEENEEKKHMRLTLVAATRNVYGMGLELLGIRALEEM